MTIHLEVVDQDEVFRNLSIEPFIINDINLDKIEDKERLNTLLYTRYEGDTLDIIPRCQCGETRGEFLVGLRCNNCKRTVESIVDREIESTLWMQCPEGIPALMNPIFWTILSKALTISNTNLLEWLCNPLYRVEGKPSAYLHKLLALDIPRGYSYFVENFDDVIEKLFIYNIFKGDKQQKEELYQFILMYRKQAFSQFLPIPSSIGFITEQTAVGTFADKTMIMAIDAVRSITSINNSLTPLNQKTKESRVVRAIERLADFYYSFSAKTLGSKPGLFRKHIFGGRSHFTGRAVITSLSENHNYEELHLPWSLSVQLLKIHLSNKMLRRGMTPLQIEKHLREHTLQYSPLLDELFQELIAESPHPLGIPVAFHRNPTLARASMQRLYVPKIKTDPKITSISVSVLILRGFNKGCCNS